MNLNEAKSSIRIVGADPEVNRVLQERILEDTDCFGLDFDEKACKECTYLSEIGDRREPVSVFCKEICATPENVEFAKLEKPAEPVEESKEYSESKPAGPLKKAKPVEEPPPIWKSMVKELYKQGLSKEEIIKQVTAEYPEVKPGKIGSVINGMRFQKAGLEKRMAAK